MTAEHERNLAALRDAQGAVEAWLRDASPIIGRLLADLDGLLGALDVSLAGVAQARSLAGDRHAAACRSAAAAVVAAPPADPDPVDVLAATLDPRHRALLRLVASGRLAAIIDRHTLGSV